MEEQVSETDRLYVPLREAGCCCGVSLHLFRDRGGSRCAVGFTTAERLADVLGARQECYRLTVRTVRELARERGVYTLMVDPHLTAVAACEHARPAGVPRVSALTGAAARRLSALDARGGRVRLRDGRIARSPEERPAK